MVMNLTGVRFSPTKQELINHYLKNKILGKTWLVDDAISEIDICNYDPMFLPSLSKIKSNDHVWYFFCPEENPKMRRRKAVSGSWKVVGQSQVIHDENGNGHEIGKRKRLVYQNSSNRPHKISWVMDEYHITCLHPDQRTYVICQVMYKGEDGDILNGGNNSAPEGLFITEEAIDTNCKKPPHTYLMNMIVGFILLLALICNIISASLDMAPAFPFRSGSRTMMLEMLETTNTNGRSSRFVSDSCRCFNNVQTNSNPSLSISGDRQTNRATFPSFFTTFHSFLVSYPMRVAVSPVKVHQVFLNFRGEQLRYNFVSHLGDVFERHEIKFFIDKYEQRGKDLKNLFVRIKESIIALAIFSTRYPESRWCMDELVIMKKLVDQGKLRVIPIFYKVEAGDVRKQTGDSEFSKNFWRLAQASSGDQIKKWKEALESISDKMGLSLGEKSFESDFVKEIVKEVQRVIEAIGLEEEENHFREDINKEKGGEFQLHI